MKQTSVLVAGFVAAAGSSCRSPRPMPSSAQYPLDDKLATNPRPGRCREMGQARAIGSLGEDDSVECSITSRQKMVAKPRPG